MQNAPVIASDLLCQNCEWPLIKKGELKCKRSKHTVFATLGQENIFCPYCKNPKVLLADENGQAICPQSQCGQRTLIIYEEEEMTTVATGKNPTKQESESRLSIKVFSIYAMILGIFSIGALAGLGTLIGLDGQMGTDARIGMLAIVSMMETPLLALWVYWFYKGTIEIDNLMNFGLRKEASKPFALLGVFLTITLAVWIVSLVAILVGSPHPVIILNLVIGGLFFALGFMVWFDTFVRHFLFIRYKTDESPSLTQS